MYFLKRNADGTLSLNKQGRQLINQFYKPPKQHGTKDLEQWQERKREH
jgi:hypothetical protein